MFDKLEDILVRLEETLSASYEGTERSAADRGGI